ncbi:YciI family protein [Pelagicoccus mobilis]|uniref:YciI family protein n=1 Tax=Pelagicoccus mobilis TaxID=415221 RepID=A0A934VSL1_9BACT|nr:YciI family protein [Pelagicoccus mobilis]MBK1880537.1 YciI family protein [Pelagicoccus mobilis]
MEYLLLIYADEKNDPGRSDNEEQNAEILNEYISFTQEARDAGVVLGLNPLQTTDAATTVRVRNGKTETTDGPFAETKEQLAGYYLVDCDNLDQALEWAAKVPGAKWGSIEVRPIWKLSGE